MISFGNLAQYKFGRFFWLRDDTRADLLSLANANNIKNASEIIDHVCETAAGWPELAKNCGVPQKMIDGIVPHMFLNI